MKINFFLKFLMVLVAQLNPGTTAWAGNAEGNGQLVVVPAGAKNPVPYEVAKSWDTGVYRNFFKLPQVNGNLEPRQKFNRDYGVSALKWLKLLETYNPNLAKNLLEVAKNTTFRMLNNYILWEHEPYPAGEVDYKTYEKAAFYNGEIILSTLVMDRLGPLANVLSQQDNQGFVIIHELINAAYPHLPIADKLHLGEMIANIKILDWPKLEFLAEIANNRQLNFLLEGEKPSDVVAAIKILEPKDLSKWGVSYISLAELEHYALIIERASSPAAATIKIYEDLMASLMAREVSYSTSWLNKIMVDLNKFYLIDPAYINFDFYEYLDRRGDTNWTEVSDFSETGHLKDYLRYKRIQVVQAVANKLKAEFKNFPIDLNSLRVLYFWVEDPNYNLFSFFEKGPSTSYTKYNREPKSLNELWKLDYEIRKNIQADIYFSAQEQLLNLMARLKINGIYYPKSWRISAANFTGIHLDLAELTKFELVPNLSNCQPASMGMDYGEVYKIISHKKHKYYSSIGSIQFQVEFSPDEKRVGKKAHLEVADISNCLFVNYL